MTRRGTRAGGGPGRSRHGFLIEARTGEVIAGGPLAYSGRWVVRSRCSAAVGGKLFIVLRHTELPETAGLDVDEGLTASAAGGEECPGRIDPPECAVPNGQTGRTQWRRRRRGRPCMAHCRRTSDRLASPRGVPRPRERRQLD